MSRESIYKRYVPAFAPESNEDGKVLWFVFNSDNLLVDLENNCKIPFLEDLKVLNIFPVRTQYMGTFLGYACYAAEVAPESNAPESMTFMDLRHLYEILEEDLFLLAGRAIQIVNWDKNHSFCGKCGTPTAVMDSEMAKICPECGFTSHTRIAPAVITAIIKDEKLLMAKHSYGLKNMYGLVAGFIEAGETLEEGVEREIMEEVGLKVKDIKYFGSQPWPFPNSLMIGFTAKYESGEIKVDGKEILEAKWFDVDEVPRTHSRMSIASDLINWYIDNYSK
jgi:NAD+ diphosphatase